MIDHLAGLCRGLTALSPQRKAYFALKIQHEKWPHRPGACAEDFPRPTDELWLGLEFAPLDTSSWSPPDERDLGAPITAIELKLLES